MSRTATSFGRLGERRASKRSSTAVATLLTFCPPGPEERTNVSTISLSSIRRSPTFMTLDSLHLIRTGARSSLRAKRSNPGEPGRALDRRVASVLAMTAPKWAATRRDSAPLPHVDEPSGDRGRRRHGGRDQMGAALVALAALEIAVRGRGAALARRELVRVHGQAHRAPGLPPLEARGEEDLVQPFRLGLRLDQPRARHDHRVDALADLAASGDLRRGAQILDAAVGAGANEGAVDGDVRHLLPALKAHVGQRALDRGALLLGPAVADA